VRAAVRDYFQQEPKAGVDPDQVVALGAAIQAAALVDSAAEAFLLDVTPLSLRIGVAGGLADTVIERNTPIPIEQTRAFTTTQDEQEKVRIRVYQGESREASENELLGEFEFGGFRKAPRGGVWIDVTFEIDADGIVRVTARDRESGAHACTRITLSSGLSDRELARILEERRTERVRSEASPGAGREVLGSVQLVPTPVRAVPEARERAARAAAVAAAPGPRLPAPGAPSGLDPSPGGDEPELELPPDEDAGLLDLRAAAGGGLAAGTPPSDAESLAASLDPSSSLFDDGDDAPELTAPEPRPAVPEAPDKSLFETPGTELDLEAPESPGRD
jgi:hypothetical protein